MTTTAEELAAKQAELQEAVLNLKAAEAEYQATRGPYLEKKSAYTASIQLVDEIDNALEAMQVDYEPPTPPGAE